ncbi:hypothetical protein KFU94_60320 [Chloroflexi bacterium TSY]|nr:hypothetical protein [Chloroflexi bacterium TSY]
MAGMIRLNDLAIKYTNWIEHDPKNLIKICATLALVFLVSIILPESATWWLFFALIVTIVSLVTLYLRGEEQKRRSYFTQLAAHFGETFDQPFDTFDSIYQGRRIVVHYELIQRYKKPTIERLRLSVWLWTTTDFELEIYLQPEQPAIKSGAQPTEFETRYSVYGDIDKIDEIFQRDSSLRNKLGDLSGRWPLKIILTGAELALHKWYQNEDVETGIQYIDLLTDLAAAIEEVMHKRDRAFQ